MAMKEFKKFNKDEIAQIKTWGAANITAILTALGVSFNDRGRYISARCPIPSHGGDRNNHTAFSWSFDKSNWRCYTHQCQEDTSSDIIGFIMALKEMSFPHAISFLFDLKEGELKNVKPVIIPEERIAVVTKENTKVDKEKLSILMPDSYFKGRGIPDDVLQKHGVGYWQKTGTFMDRRAIIPIFDIDGELVGFSGRITVQDDKQSKWVHGKDFVTRKSGIFNKGSVLYNLNNCKESVKKTKKVFIVEGPIDLWKLEMAGIYNVVATLGLGLSFEQQRLLVTLGVDTIVVCYDNDTNGSGTRAANIIKDQLSTMFNVEIKLPKSNKDYGEMSTTDILQNLINE